MEAAQRTALRAQLTKQVNNATEMLTSNAEFPDINELKVSLAKIKTLKSELREVSEKVIKSLSEAETAQNVLENEYLRLYEYEDSALTIITKLEFVIQKSEKAESISEIIDDRNSVSRSPSPRTSNHPDDLIADATGGPHTQQGYQREAGIVNSRMSIRLPYLELKKFYGDINDWPQFWQQFKAVVHDNETLDEHAKFIYLKSLIAGKARPTIDCLVPNKACYENAIQLLQHEYGNTERIIDSYVQKLMTLSAIKNRNDAKALRHLYNTAIGITRSLESLGVSANEYGILVKSVLLKIIPYSMRVDFNRLISGNDIPDNVSAISNDSEINDKIKQLLNFIKVEVESIEAARGSEDCDDGKTRKQGFGNRTGTADSRNNKNNVRDRSDNGVSSFTAAGLVTDYNKLNCLFCESKTHASEKCDSSLSINDKKAILKNKNCCFRCTRPKHSSKNCKSKVFCNSCKNRHATSMCDPNYMKRSVASPKEDVPVNSTALFSANSKDNVFLQTARAFLSAHDGGTRLFVRMVIDGGSTLTFIKDTVSRQLGLEVIGQHKMSIFAFGNTKSGPVKVYNRVRLQLQSQYKNETIQITAVEVPEICFDSMTTPASNDPAIQGLHLADTNVHRVKQIDGISLLIGADHYWTVVTGEHMKISDNLMAMQTSFGWTLLGEGSVQQQNSNLNIAAILNVQTLVEDDAFNDHNIKKFWDLESIGIKNVSDSPNEEMNQFIETKINFNGTRYEVELPWKQPKENLNDNFEVASVRLKTLTSHLIRDNKIAEYDSIIRQQLSSEICEIAPKPISSKGTYYMPHRPVYRPDKPPRIVFDASSSSRGCASLNQMLHAGQNLVPELLQILLKFRLGKIGLISDIEKAFLQIELKSEERNTHSFLWYERPIGPDGKLSNILTYQMRRVTFGVTSSPFLLAATLKKHLQGSERKEICEILSQSFYVDDLVLAVGSREEAVKIYEESNKILNEANMKLRKWNSNDFEVRKTIGAETSVTKVLGITWDVISDEFRINLSNVLEGENVENPTKRLILKVMSRIFDPLGVFGPFVVRAKLLLQKVWKKGLDWDEPLPDDLKLEWLSWCAEIKYLEDFSVPRSIITDKKEETELHIFSDASPQAYGAVAYLKSNETKCYFMTAKSRVSPIKENGDPTLTLPRLELTAILCAARIQKYLIENLKIRTTQTYIWTDSKIAIHWINGNQRKLKSYVQNRVMEIRKTAVGTLKYCPSKENPADLLTRGVKAQALIKSELWKEGPEFLKDTREFWPEGEEISIPKHEIVMIINTDIPEDKNDFNLLIKFSNLQKILRITAYVMRFIKNLKGQRYLGELTAEELNEAEEVLVKLEQKKAFPDEIKSLRKGTTLNQRSSILTLNPILDEKGILRVGGRLQEASLPFENKHPIILPKKSPLSEHLIWSCHKEVLHGSVNATLNAVRNKYWIIKGRQRIKTILGKCVVCRRMRGKPAQEQFAPVPRDRLTEVRAFFVTGIDFAGPLYIIVGDEKQKVYIMLFTCAVTRAVHLELTNGISTEDTIRGLRRFIARRGVPKTVYSDNARSFKRASYELSELAKTLESDEVKNVYRSHRISWKFIVERASWWGGWWERLVQSVKNGLKFSLGRALVSYDELLTILTEVECCVNSRPLTYIDDDAQNLPALTPAHFLTGHSQASLLMNENNLTVTNKDIAKCWANRLILTKTFWKRWTNEYLQQLRSFHHKKHTRSVPLSVGDVVLVCDQNLPRLAWKLARVTQTYIGRDGRVRSCDVRLANGTSLKRPIQLLCPLEVDSPRPPRCQELATTPTASPEAASTEHRASSSNE